MEDGMMGWFKRRALPQRFSVQLHRVERVGEWPSDEWRVVYSWEPATAWSIEKAREVAHRLRCDNKWGTGDAYPCVTITDPAGVQHPEWA